MTKKFEEYVALAEALKRLRSVTTVRPSQELVPLAQSYGRFLSEDIVSLHDIPPRDTAHMDGYAVRSSDLRTASKESPVELRLVRGSPLGVVPKKEVKTGEAQTILTGGFLPEGSDAVVQVERTQNASRRVVFTSAPSAGDYVFKTGRDVRRGDRVLRKGRSIRGTDLVLLGSLHRDTIPVYTRPRVAVIPTGNELTEDVKDARPGKVVETHGLLLSKLVREAGGIPVQMPIARDELDVITRSLKAALKTADIVLTLAGSSVGEADLTESAINAVGRPGVVVHGMKVHRGRVMGFGAVSGKAIIILPGPIQGAVNAFALMAYPLIRSFLGRGFESPFSVPATITNSWKADRYPDFTKVVYVRMRGERSTGLRVTASTGETEKMTFLTQNDGYILVDESTTSLAAGDPVRVYLLPGLSPI